MSATERLIAAMHTAGGTTYATVADWHTLAQRDDNLRNAFKPVFGRGMPTPKKLAQWLLEHVGPQGEHLLSGQHSKKRKAWAYRVLSQATIAEEERQRQEAEAALRAQLEAQQAAARAAAAARDAAVVAAAAAREAAVQRGLKEVREATAKYDGTAAPAAKPPEVQPAPPPKDDVRPVWMREGRQPTRAEWLEHQRARGAVHKQAFAGSSSQTDWFVRACEARNRGFR